MDRNNLFVIDTNILISAFILPKSVSRKVLDKARREGTLVVSKSSIDEFVEVFIRPKFDKYLPLEIRLEIIDDFISLAQIVTPSMKIFECRDPKDNKFLEIACSANVQCIVTGDQDMLVLNPFREVPIITALDFLNS